MIRRSAIVPGEVQQIAVAGGRRRGCLIPITIDLQLGCMQQPPCQPHAVDCHLPVSFVREIVGLNDRVLERIGRLGTDEAGAVRAQLVKPQSQSWKGVQLSCNP